MFTGHWHNCHKNSKTHYFSSKVKRLLECDWVLSILRKFNCVQHASNRLCAQLLMAIKLWMWMHKKKCSFSKHLIELLFYRAAKFAPTYNKLSLRRVVLIAVN